MPDKTFPEASVKELLDTITSGVCVYRVENEGLSGSDYRILYFNRYAILHEKKPLSEIIGKSLKDLRPTIDDYGLIDIFRSVWKTGEPGFFPANVYVDEKYSNWYENRVFSLSDNIIVAIFDDVTDKYQAEINLRKSEERLREVINAMEKAVAVYEPVNGGADFRFVEMNGFGEKLTGYTVEQVLGKTILELFPEEASVGLIDGLKQCLETGETTRIPLKQYRDSRVTQWIENTIFKLPSGNVVAIFEDTYLQHRAEEELRKNEELLRSYIDNAPFGFFLAGPDGEYLDVNSGAREITGYSREELLGMNLMDLIPEDSTDLAAEHFRAVQEQGRITGSIPFIDKSGNRKIWEIRAVRLSENRFMAFTVDETENNAMREELRKNQERYLQAEKLGLVGSWEYNVQTDEFWGSEGAKRIYGFDPHLQSFSAEAVEERIPQRERVRRALVNLIEHDIPYDLEFEIIPENSSTPKRITSIGELVRDEKGRPLKVAGMIQDITARVEADKAIRINEEKYRSLFENMRDAMFITDMNRHLTDCNQAFLDLFRCSRSQAIGNDVVMFYSSQPEYQKVGEYLERVSDGSAEPFITAVLKRNDGSEFHGEISIYRKVGSPGSMDGLTGLIRDVSQRELLQAQVRQSQKMQAIGQLAGGIAHDFNNLLTIINGYSYMLLESMDESDPSIKELREIQNAGHRAASLTRQLLAFSRKQMLKPERIDLNTRITETESMLKRLIGENILLETRLADHPVIAEVDPGQFDQIILNLSVNSRDAMPKGGRLLISTGTVELNSEEAAKYDLENGLYSTLGVKDNGSGISDQDIDHIFEPFYTTKETGQGTGMGLPTVYGIVKQSCGGIGITSKAGSGTEVTVFLPRLEGEHETDSDSFCISPILSQGELILLVEDEEAVRELIKTSLTASGFSVIAVADGLEALQVLNREQKLPDLLLSDVMMPGISGRELVEEVLKTTPGLSVCFMSGYTDETIEKLGILSDDVSFIQKPFLPSELVNLIRSILDGKA